MSVLRQAVSDYLAIRRAMGFKLEQQERLLAQFIGYLEDQGAATVTIDHAVAWVMLPPSASGDWLALRMTAVRGFARHLHTIDPACQVPPIGLIPSRRQQRAVPYLYSTTDISALLSAAAQTLHGPLRVTTWQTLICLLTVTGMRPGEAIGLDDTDVDADTGLITVREAKFGKSRHLPLHPSASRELLAYQRRRDKLYPRPHAPALFISTAGTRLRNSNVGRTFTALVRHAGLRSRSARCGPRLMDMRHTFAVATLLAWYQDGGDIPSRLPLLSTYLGHTDPRHTYWYLSAAPELLTLAAQRLDAHLNAHTTDRS